MEQTAPTQQTKTNWKLPLLFLLIGVLIGSGLCLAYHYSYLLTHPSTTIESTQQPIKEKISTNISFTDIYGQIQNKGSISSVKTVNTDKWTNYSDTITENKTLKFTYQYPEHLLAVRNARPGTNSVYYFKNNEGYKNFIACISDKTVLSENSAPRDWEGGCDLAGDVLFITYFDFFNSTSFNLTSFDGIPTSSLVWFTGWTDDFSWVLPKEGSMPGGIGNFVEMVAEGNTRLEGKKSERIYTRMMINPKNVEEIKTITGMDMYPFFLHFLSTIHIAK